MALSNTVKSGLTMSRIISIISLMPNTGKTTIALNLGLALHRMKKNVIVLDADFSKINMIEHIDFNQPVNLEEVFQGRAHLFDTIFRHSSGLRIIPSMTKHDYDKLQFHLPELFSGYEYVIIDTPKDHESLKKIMNNIDEALIVHSPEYGSRYLMNAIKLLKKHKILNLGIVLNKSHEESVNSMFSIPVITKIPHHKSIVKSFNVKQPLLHIYPYSDISRKFYDLAKRLV